MPHYEIIVTISGTISGTDSGTDSGTISGTINQPHKRKELLNLINSSLSGIVCEEH